MAAGYIFTRFGMLYQEKSGNPGVNASLEDPLLITQILHNTPNRSYALLDVLGFDE
jgi:hypothetical protein